MHHLLKYFDRISVISLPDRTDRREKLLANLSACGLAAEDDITWFDAIDARQAKLPDWWEAERGAWGCRLSQLGVIEQAQRDGLKNVLIIEDDAVFHPRAAEWLESTVPLLPSDWAQYFLGGQHMVSPKPTKHPKIIKGQGIIRTHAYAVNQTAYQVIIDQISDESLYQERRGGHIDHQFAYCHEKGLWNAYAPSWWMAGQDEGGSDIIESRYDQRRWWQLGSHYWKIPFVHISKDRYQDCAEWLHVADGIFCPPPSGTGALAVWLRDVSRSAWQQGRLPAFDSGTLDPSLVARLWPAGVREVEKCADIVALADYPNNGLFSHPFTLS